MKKLIVLLLALTVVGFAVSAQAAAAAAAPAPALVWGAYVETGFTYDQSGSGDALLGSSEQAWNPGLGFGAPAFDLYAKYNAGNYGLAYRIRSNADWTNRGNAAINLNRAYGWVSAFNNMVTFSAGKFGHGTYQTGGWEEFGDWYRTNGVAIDVTPMDGLKFGVMVPMDDNGVRTATQTLDLFWAGFDYTMKDMFEVVFAYQNQQTYYHGDTGYTTDPPLPQSGDASIYVNILAVPNLTAYVEAQLGNIGSTTGTAGDNGYYYQGSDAYTKLYEYASYDMKPVSFGLAVEENMWEASALGSDYQFDLFGTYTMGTTDIGADIYYAIAGKTAGYADNLAGYGIAPFVKFNINDNSFLKIGVSYFGGDIASYCTYADSTAAGGSSSLYSHITDASTNVFCDFVIQI